MTYTHNDVYIAHYKIIILFLFSVKFYGSLKLKYAFFNNFFYHVWLLSSVAFEDLCASGLVLLSQWLNFFLGIDIFFKKKKEGILTALWLWPIWGQNKNNSVKKYKIEKIVTTYLYVCLKKRGGGIWISPKTINQEKYYRKLSFDM